MSNSENREIALHWLAMNIPLLFWPGGDGDAHIMGETFTQREWEKKRREIIGEPEDSTAPEWANWKAQDLDGRWYWHETKPARVEEWWCSPYLFDQAGKGMIPTGHDWQETLLPVRRNPTSEKADQ